MQHSYALSYDNLLLKPLAKSDIESLRIWRNEKENTLFLSPAPFITEEMQQKWFESYLINDDLIIFSIFENSVLNRLVGSIAAYNFNHNSNSCEVGKLQIGDKEAHGKKIGYKSMAILACFLFKEFGLAFINAIVHKDNAAAIKSYLKVGFKIVGESQTKSVLPGLDYQIVLTADDCKINNAEIYNSLNLKC